MLLIKVRREAFLQLQVPPGRTGFLLFPACWEGCGFLSRDISVSYGPVRECGGIILGGVRKVRRRWLVCCWPFTCSNTRVWIMMEIISFSIYFLSEVRRGEYWGLGVFLLQNFPLITI